ncbi:hypothetical protein ACIQ7Q_24525 [Streptomyces sp. NPDC096176]|uniref:hypothetical protein n=1 Tax=Streptomyces sp. NPDC096176 TaxID=3366079 RepID=UPI003813698E
MATIRAPNLAKALHRTRKLLTPLLPLDVITSHYPDASGHVLLNIALPEDAHRHLKRNARAHHRSPAEHLSHTITQALARTEQHRAMRLATTLDELLAWNTPHQLLAAAARRLDPPTIRTEPPGVEPH